jgi:large subunit ribosomal protein L22
MGSKKRLRAEQASEERKNKYFAVLKNCPTSPRKMRLVADQIRGVDVNKALDILKFSPKEASNRLEKLLKSAIANWGIKNEGERMENANLFVKEVFVDSARVLKRLRPAPQGRAHRIRKRSNHVTLILGSVADKVSKEIQETKDIQTKE